VRCALQAQQRRSKPCAVTARPRRQRITNYIIEGLQSEFLPKSRKIFAIWTAQCSRKNAQHNLSEVIL